jgi:heme oxygenase (mycobilin-producing)
MNIYITAGTYDFLEKLAEKHGGEHMVLMSGEEGALLLHETPEKTVFNSPRKYEVLEAVGAIEGEGLVIMNNIPVTDEGRPGFEYRFKNRAGKIENTEGFKALRVLRPLGSNTYVILTVWEDEVAFHRWKESDDFSQGHGHGGSGNASNIFAGQSYVSRYTIG